MCVTIWNRWNKGVCYRLAWTVWHRFLRWTAGQIWQRKGGQKFDGTPQVLAGLELEPDAWCLLATQFTDLFSWWSAAGKHR